MGLVHGVSGEVITRSLGFLSWLPHYTSCSEYHNYKDKNIPKVWTLLDWIVYSESAWAIVWTLHICILNYLAEFKILFCFFSFVHVFLFCFELNICPCRRIWNLLPGLDLRWLCLVCTWFSEVLDACIPGLLWLVWPGYFGM